MLDLYGFIAFLLNRGIQLLQIWNLTIQNLDCLQPNLFSTIQNPDKSGYQILPTVQDCDFEWWKNVGIVSDF